MIVYLYMNLQHHKTQVFTVSATEFRMAAGSGPVMSFFYFSNILVKLI